MPLPIMQHDLTDQERRWMVHVFAALRQAIQDELEYAELPYHDPRVFQEDDRLQRLWQYVAHELTRCMERTHPEEAAFLAGTLPSAADHIVAHLGAGIGHLQQAINLDDTAQVLLHGDPRTLSEAADAVAEIHHRLLEEEETV